MAKTKKRGQLLLLRLILTITMLSACFPSLAELSDLSDSELSGVSGEGVALVFEDFQFEMKDSVLGGDAGNDFTLTGIEDSSNNDVTVTIGQAYLSGTGSSLGTSLDGKLVNLGRLNNPISIDLLDGNDLGSGSDGWQDKSVLSIAAPTQYANQETDPELPPYHADGYSCTDANAAKGSGLCSSRPDGAVAGFQGERFDMGYRINREFVDTSKNVNLNFHAQSANVDGSYLRFWGGDADADGNSTTDSSIMMEIQLNFYANKLVFDSCDLDGLNCGEQIGFGDFSMELALGDAKYYQPMTLDVTNDGFLNVTIQALPSPGDTRTGGGAIGSDGQSATSGASDVATWAWYDDYYTNGRHSNISISDLTVGAESFGGSSIQGLQIQYLEVISHEI